MVERRKANQASGRLASSYFWRTYDQKEIDCIEEYGGRLYGYEFKWSKEEIRQATRKEFCDTYPDSTLAVVHQGNFEPFLL